MSREKYQTNAKKRILEEVKKQNGHFTAKNLKEKLENISYATIYRVLEEFALEGTLKKYFRDTNTAYYEYFASCEKENHFYLKCTKCGHKIHVDCDCMKEFENHVLKTHHFSIEENKVMMMGICNDCKKKGVNYGTIKY